MAIGKVNTSISIDKHLHKSGLRRAKEECRNFSSYIEWLIHLDVKADQERRDLAAVRASRRA